jgi:hypothetical protein
MFDTALEFWDYAWILVIVALAVSGLSRYFKPKERPRLGRLEAKVDLLLSLPISPRRHFQNPGFSVPFWRATSSSVG